MEETSILQQKIKKDNSKSKPGNHTVRNRIQFANRTTEIKDKLLNRINNNNRYPTMSNTIDAINKLIGYSIPYCYFKNRQRLFFIDRTSKQRTVGVNCRKSTCIERYYFWNFPSHFYAFYLYLDCQPHRKYIKDSYLYLYPYPLSPNYFN